MLTRRLDRLLVIEDDPVLASAIQQALTLAGRDVRVHGNIAEGLATLRTWHPEVLLLDVALPDGSALDVVRALEAHAPRPVIIAMSGSAHPRLTFELARLGVEHFLPKPLELSDLEAALREVAQRPPDLTPALRVLVGRRPIQDVEDEVRATMVREALAHSGGSVRQAARLLSLSRQTLQHILRKCSLV